MNHKVTFQKFLESTLYLNLKKRKKIILFFLCCLSAILLVLLLFYSMMLPKDTASEAFEEFEVKSGSNAHELAKNMYNKGLIKSPLVFSFYAKIKGYDVKIKSGTYLVGPSMSIDEILQKMVSGNTLIKGEKITIPEGSTLDKISSLFQNHNLISKKDFLNAAKPEYYKEKYDFLKDFPPNATLEGFLFPDTYYLPKNKPAKYYLEILLKRFSDVYFGKGLYTYQKRLGLDTYEVITLASIIEAEAKVEGERPLISAVFHNRLKKGMALQSCATVEYALKEHKEFLSLEDIKVDSPYNTYKYSGLPFGPIGSPGVSSIEAALNPAAVDFLFFVARGDGTHIFSRTFDEHMKNKSLIQKPGNNVP